jgi:hypothetical protein
MAHPSAPNPRPRTSDRKHGEDGAVKRSKQPTRQGGTRQLLFEILAGPTLHPWKGIFTATLTPRHG